MWGQRQRWQSFSADEHIEHGPMNTTSQQAAQLSQRAMSALRQGDANTARSLFQQATSASDRSAASWLGLAFANAQLGDSKATLVAVDKALALEPHNMRALLFKGDHLAHEQQTRKALVFYQAALKLAARETSIPADVQTGLQRAESCCQRFAGEYEDYLLQRLQSGGYRPSQSHPRFDQALDIAFGKIDIYYQQPTRFYYPGLPQIEIYPRKDFPWLDEVEAATDAIRRELLAVMGNKDNFTPYLQSDPDTAYLNDTSNLDNDEWSAFYFYQEGKRVEENAARCPETMRILDAVPLPQVPGSTPHALFSKLAGGARIPPHVGLINTRLICHLPLIVPKNCGALRVGSQQIAWREGEAFVFDDSMEHEAWNDSDQERVVLLFDLWRPELDAGERELISAMLQAVLAYEAETDTD
jgi:aspartyl/asparaginyl beta-hydroxylase (cupin superfamily)